MAIMTTGSHPKALWPGIKTWFGRFYDEHAAQYPELFDIESSSQNFEEDVQVVGMGLSPVKDQGRGIDYTSMRQGWLKRYSHIVYGQGYIVTEEEIEDNLYEKVARSYARALAFSMSQTKEIVAANVYNRLTNTSYVGGDGSALGVTDHTTESGDQSNILSSAADISEAALEDMVKQMMDATDDKGLNIPIRPKCLIVPNEEIFNVQRILKTELQSDSANNDIGCMVH